MAKIRIIQGDISAIVSDALVNAANNHLWMGSGVAGALKRVGGEEIEREAVARGPIPVGSAVETTAGRLHAKYVIHGAVMGQDLTTSSELIRRTTASCLELAIDLGLSSIAFPAFGCGVGGMDYKDAARAMKDGIDSLDDQSLEGLHITIVLFGRDAFTVFNRLFDE
ncbi:MAG: macro domain-containing protein [Thermoplasmatota archaeon]